MTTPEDTYPPKQHIIRDLAPVIERNAEGAEILLPVVPELLDDGGRLRAGSAAMIVDIIAGEYAIREVLPNWVATSNMSLQLGLLPSEGTLRARPRLLRRGKTTAVLEVSLDHLESGKSNGLSTVAFSILPGRSEFQTRAHWVEEPEPRTTFALSGSGFRKPLLEMLDVRFDPADTSVLRIEMSPYVVNTLGAIQGGVVAMAIDAAADHYATSVLGAAPYVRSLEIHYLKLAKIGPVRAQVRTISELQNGLALRVELRDEGQSDVLLTVASVILERS